MLMCEILVPCKECLHLHIQGDSKTSIQNDLFYVTALI